MNSVSGWAWDEGVRWFSRRTVAPTALPVSVAHVRDQVLRVANGTVEDAYIEGAVWAAVAACERDTGRALVPQTWELILSRFPIGTRPIILPRVPLIGVDSVSYVDEDGVTQTLAVGSPADFETIPSGEFVRGRIVPLYSEVWPTTRLQEQAVTVTFQCGYEHQAYPEELLSGIYLFVQSLYQRQAPDRMLSRFWRKVEG